MQLQFEGLGFFDCNDYWAPDCRFQIQMGTNRLLMRTFAGWHDVEVYALPHCNLLGVCVQVADWWVGWEPNHFL